MMGIPVEQTTDSHMTDEARQQNAIRQLGQYLLAGWVMTDDECGQTMPGGERCGIPLMRSKDGGYSFCSLCCPPAPGVSAWDPAPSNVGSSSLSSQRRSAGEVNESEAALEAEIAEVQRRLRSEARGKSAKIIPAA